MAKSIYKLIMPIVLLFFLALINTPLADGWSEENTRNNINMELPRSSTDSEFMSLNVNRDIEVTDYAVSGFLLYIIFLISAAFSMRRSWFNFFGFLPLILVITFFILNNGSSPQMGLVIFLIFLPFAIGYLVLLAVPCILNGYREKLRSQAKTTTEKKQGGSTK